MAQVLIIDILSNAAWRLRYDFATDDGGSTSGLPRTGASAPYAAQPESAISRRRDHAPGSFAQKVDRAKEEFKVGNLFESVLSQVTNLTERTYSYPTSL